MKNSFYIICGVIIFGTAVLMSACTLPRPRCEPDELEMVEIISPDCTFTETYPIDPSGPYTIEWTYPETSCVPDFFEFDTSSPLRPGRVDFDSLPIPGPWSRETQPYPRRGIYHLRIAAGLENGSEPDYLLWSNRECFHVGPRCTEEEILPPDLVSPPDQGFLKVRYKG